MRAIRWEEGYIMLHFRLTLKQNYNKKKNKLLNSAFNFQHQHNIIHNFFWRDWIIRSKKQNPFYQHRVQLKIIHGRPWADLISSTLLKTFPSSILSQACCGGELHARVEHPASFPGLLRWGTPRMCGALHDHQLHHLAPGEADRQPVMALESSQSLM